MPPSKQPVQPTLDTSGALWTFTFDPTAEFGISKSGMNVTVVNHREVREGVVLNIQAYKANPDYRAQ